MWNIATSTHASDARTIVFRYRAFAGELPRAKLPVRIILVWKYNGENGMPSIAERTRMDEMEDRLDNLAEGEGSRLVMISTGENLREWTFYAQSEQSFMTALNLALKGVRPYPIEIHAESDPTWETYRRFKDGVKEK